MKKILITGSSGFIGQSLVESLFKLNKPVRGALRSTKSFSPNSQIEYVSIGDISLKTNWENALVGIDCVIHCAGETHRMNKIRTDDLKIYQSVNVDGTKQLAEQAAKAGVKRLIFLSSIKVIGENSDNRYNNISLNNQKKYSFTFNNVPNPENYHSVSKFEAEKILWEISVTTGLEVVVVRLPLVYGYGVKGNLMRLMKLINSGIPLPFSLIDNKRSFIGIDNLVDLLICCIDHPKAKGKTFLASDGKDLSTPELIKLIASSMGRKARLFPLPLFMLKFLGSIFGKQKEINRLIGSLNVNIDYTKETLNWTPSVNVKEGIRRMVQGK